MNKHIVPRASRGGPQNSRSASCGPAAFMEFDPAAAAAATVGEENDGVYIPAGQAEKPNKKTNPVNSNSNSGAVSQPLGNSSAPSAWQAMSSSKFVPEPPTNLRLSGGRTPEINAISAPARGSALARYAARSSEEETVREEEEEEIEGSQTERDDYVTSSMRSKGAAATFVLQDPPEQDHAGLCAYSGRSQLDVAAKRALVDLRLDGPTGKVRMHAWVTNYVISAWAIF